MLSRAKADTPTLFDVGKAAFRSQVSIAILACRHDLLELLPEFWSVVLITASTCCLLTYKFQA